MSGPAAWTEPCAEPVAPGVFRIALPLPGDGLRAVNVYAVCDRDGLVLIDGGWAVEEAFSALEKALGAIGHDPADIKRFLVTHIHRDHLTLALDVRRRFGAQVALGLGEKPSLGKLIAGDHSGPLAHLRAWGAEELADRIPPSQLQGPKTESYEPPDQWLDGPADILLADRTLRALPTPGHTRGHVVYADFGSGLLFAGDHVLPHITPSIGYEPVRSPLPLADYLRSLHLVRSLPDMRLLPAHGPVAASVHQRTDELIEHHERRLDTTAQAVDGQGRSAYQTARTLPWTRHDRSFDSLDPLNQVLAVGETAAHLDVLVRRGLLHAVTSGGIVHYRQEHIS
ncbi:MBL fold metallo-hydrolase [Streptomyces chartreusis]|uniref:MBL fold metallo-hydrolase n=1 Tax=Streptomyces chartreusis TaxID=1969 RepID=UPI00342F681F